MIQLNPLAMQLERQGACTHEAKLCLALWTQSPGRRYE
jgi:hypothetical protein